MTTLLALPLELLILIFSKLPDEALCKCRETCKRLLQVCTSDFLWTPRLAEYDLKKEDFPKSEPSWQLYQYIAYSPIRGLNDLIKVTYCDGGQFSDFYGVHKLFASMGARACYCSARKSTDNITVIAELRCMTWFRRAMLLLPNWGFTSPVTDLLMFICKQKPAPEDFVQFNNFTEKQVETYRPTNDDLRIAVAKFNLTSAEKFVQCPLSRAGRYIVVKLLRSGGTRENLDAGSITMVGTPLDSTVILMENPNRKADDKEEEEEDDNDSCTDE